MNHGDNIKCSVCITRSYEDDNLLLKALNSLKQQKKVSLHIYILDQQISKTIKDYSVQNSTSRHTFYYHTISPTITSKARNKGIDLAKTGIMFTTDPDCICDPYWAYELRNTLIKKNCCVVGGKILPMWEISPPLFTKSKYINEFYSLIDLGNSQKEISKALTANFAVNVDVLKQENIFFNSKTGRTKKSLLGGEDTQLCYELKQKNYSIYYTGRATVYHLIQKEKLSYKWLFRRVYYGGVSKVQRKQYRVAPFNKKISVLDIIFVSMVFPAYIFGYLRGAYLNKIKR